MKKIFKLLPALALGMIAMGTVSCSESNDESCEKYNVSSCTLDDVTICTDDNGDTYYTYQGKRYNNVDDIAQVCSGGNAEVFKSAKIELDAFTAQLFINAKSAAECN